MDGIFLKVSSLFIVVFIVIIIFFIILREDQYVPLIWAFHTEGHANLEQNISFAANVFFSCTKFQMIL